jgi:subtilase family serine protease
MTTREDIDFMAEQYNEGLAMIVITDTVEHEDGSATYTFDIDDLSSKKITEFGLEFIITCAAYGLDIQEALNHLAEYGKSIEGPYTAEEVEEML